MYFRRDPSLLRDEFHRIDVGGFWKGGGLQQHTKYLGTWLRSCKYEGTVVAGRGEPYSRASNWSHHDLRLPSPCPYWWTSHCSLQAKPAHPPTWTSSCQHDRMGSVCLPVCLSSQLHDEIPDPPFSWGDEAVYMERKKQIDTQRQDVCVGNESRKWEVEVGEFGE